MLFDKVFSENKFYPNKTFRLLVLEKLPFKKNEFKIIALSLNSIIFIIEVISHISQATGTFSHLQHDDLKRMHILDPSKLDPKEKQTMLTFFDKIKKKN